VSVEADISSFYQELKLQFFLTDEGSPAPSSFYSSSCCRLLICFSFLWQSSFFHPLRVLYSSVSQGYAVFCFEDDEGDLIADMHTYLTEGTSWFLDPFAENVITHTMPLQETCVETLVRYPDDALGY